MSRSLTLTSLELLDLPSVHVQRSTQSFAPLGSVWKSLIFLHHGLLLLLALKLLLCGPISLVLLSLMHDKLHMVVQMKKQLTDIVLNPLQAIRLCKAFDDSIVCRLADP